MNISATLVFAVTVLAAPAPDLADPGPTAVLKDIRPDPKDKKGNEEFVLGEVPRLKSSDVIRATMRLPDVAALPLLQGQAKPVPWLREKLRVVADAETGLVRVSLPGYSTNEQLTIVNALVETYVEEVERERREAYTRSLKSFERERDFISYDLQRRLAIPPELRDPIDVRWIPLHLDALARENRLIEDCRRELSTRWRLQIQERAKGRRP